MIDLKGKRGLIVTRAPQGDELYERLSVQVDGFTVFRALFNPNSTDAKGAAVQMAHSFMEQNGMEG